MPEKVIDIPGLGSVAFPESMTPDQINVAAAKLYQEKNPSHPKPDPAHSWIDTAVDWLPTTGGIIGGILGGIGGTVGGMGVGGVPGAVGGAAVGGMGGEGIREAIQTYRGKEKPRQPGQALKDIGVQGAIQGGTEVVGGAVGRVMAKAAPALMQSALKPGLKQAMKATIKGETPRVVQTLLDEGITVSPRGMEKLNTILMATNDEIKAAIASVNRDVNPFKVTAKLGETAQSFAKQVNPASDLEAVSRVGQEFLETHPRMTIQEAQAIKQGTYKQIAGKYGELKGAEVEAQKALARGLKDEIASEVDQSLVGLKGKLGLEGGVDITKANAREGGILEGRDALARRLSVAGRRDPMGLASLAITHPVTFLTVLMDRSPAVKSMLARGLYSSAGAASRVSPQLIKAAVTAIATSGDTASSDQQSTEGQP